MKSREEVINYCKSLKDVYEDAPFHDDNWTVMRLKKNKKSFAYVYERHGDIWINVKSDPDVAEFFRSAYSAVIPAYHMNKRHWNSIILNGTVPKQEIENMIRDSYNLCKGNEQTK